MRVTQRVKKILSHYESDNPGTKANLARILMEGKLGGTGKLVILPVDQGFEHGPARSFAPNPPAYDPHYHFQLAIDAGLSAYAAPLGMIEAGADSFAGAIPTILKLNSSNSLATDKDQAVTGSVSDALRLGCSPGWPWSSGPIRAAPISTRRPRPRSISAPMPPIWRLCSAPISSR
jgi:class I fructose-bisphosphate aldolase